MLDLIDITDDDPNEDVEYAAWRIEGETQRNVGRFVRVMWITLGVLALFNSAQLVNVVNGFGVGPVQNAIVAVSATWNAQMELNKLDQPMTVIRDTMLRLHDLQWSEIHVSFVSPRDAQALRGTHDPMSPAG